MRIAVFAKAPVAGEVKTRLQALLGAEGAARLHACLVRHALSVAVASRTAEVTLHCAPDTTHAFFAECAREFGIGLEAQQGADLGARMQRAFAKAFDAGAALIVIGSDCPGLDAARLIAAREALRTHDSVLIPAEDGGYALIGLARPVAGLFANVDWGSDAVLAQTRERLEHAGAHWLELEPLWDVDRPEDYARLQREGPALEDSA